MSNRFSRTLFNSCFSSGRWFLAGLLLAAVTPFIFPIVADSTFGVANPCVAQTVKSQTHQVDLTKAMKYHSALLRRPNPGYLYDRFYTTWLDTASLEELKAFLIKRANASQADPAERLLLAFFYAKQNDDVEALQQFRLALKDDPKNAATLYELAIIQARTLDLDSALKNLDKASKTDPSPSEEIKIAQLQGKLLALNSQTKEAVKVWDDLLARNPNDLGLMEDLVELQISLRMFEQAEALSDKLTDKTKDPFQKVTRRLRKGDLLQRSGKRSEALEVYRGLLEQVGMNTWIEREIIAQIEQLFRFQDDLVGLDVYLLSLTKANNKRVAIQISRANILMELGEVDKAIQSYEKIIALTPGNRENREAFTDLLIRADKNDRAVKQLEALVTEHPKDAELQIRLAELHHKISAPLKAKAALDKFVMLSGDTEYSYLRSATLFEKFGDLDNAKLAYRTALDKYKDSSSLKESWADFLFRSGSQDEAVKIWQQLAKGSDRENLVRLARLIAVRQMHQVAFDLLLARYEDFKLDSIYLGQLCTEAVDLEKFLEAVEWATERVRLAKTTGEVDSALSPAILIINAAEQNESVIQSLRNKSGRTAAETCLLIEMLERASLGKEADSLLRAGLDTNNAAAGNQDVQIFARQRVNLAKMRHDWEGAVHAARELLEVPGGRNSPNVRQLVELYIQTNDKKSAMKWITDWKRLSPKSLLPWLTEANILQNDGQPKKSIAILRNATRLFPDDPNLFAQLAKKHIRNGQNKDASLIFWRQFEKSEKLSDKLRWVEQLARLANDEDKIEPLLERFKKRRVSNPQSIEPLLSIALINQIAGNYDERRAALLTATRLKKTDLSLLFQIAKLEKDEGDWDRAIQTLQRAVVLDKTTQAKGKLARLQLLYGDTDEGLNLLLEISGGMNSTASDVEKISKSIVESKFWQPLLDFLAPNIARFPNNYRLRYMAAVANEELGRTEIATKQFLDLLQVTEEIPVANSVVNQPIQKQTNSKPSLPQSAIDLQTRLSNTSKYANSYQITPGIRPLARLNLPTTSKMCRDFSLSRLREIGLKLPQQALDNLQTKLEKAGVKNAHLLLTEFDRLNLKKDPMALVAIDPDNEATLAIAAVANNDAYVSQEVCLKAVERFKDSFPVVSFLAACKLDQTKPENQTRLADAVKRLKTLKEPDSLLMSFVSKSSNRKSVAFLKHRVTLSKLVFDWYPPTSQRSIYGVARVLQEEDSPKRLIEFLDRELDRFKTQPVFGSSSRYGGSRTSIIFPDYPLNELFLFPRQILDQTSLPLIKVPEAVSTARDPMLKLLLQLKYFHQRDQGLLEQMVDASEIAELEDSIKAAFGGQVTDAKSAIDQLTDQYKNNVDYWYLAGALAVYEKRWEDAAVSFETLRKLPLTASMRVTIDGHLVALATQGLKQKVNDAEHKQVLNSARSAVLRLRRGVMSNNKRSALLYALNQLELYNEADKLRLQTSYATIAKAGSAGTKRPEVASDRIKRLIKSKDVSTATQLLASEFQWLVRHELNLNSTKTINWENFRRKVERVEMTSQLVKFFNPGESTNTRKLKEWGCLQKFLGDKQKAKEAYEKILKAHPQEDAIRLQCVLLDPARAGELFTREFPKVNKRSRRAFMLQLTKRITNEGRLPFFDQLSLAESITEYKEGEDGNSIGDNTMLSLLQILGTRTSVRLHTSGSVTKVASVYTKLVNKNPQVRTKTKQLKELDAAANRRRMLHDRIALWLTVSAKPRIAGKAATALFASTEAAGKPVDAQLLAVALKVVRGIKNSAPLNTSDKSKGYLPSSTVIQRSPVQFLARYYGTSEGDHQQRVESIAEYLESIRAKVSAADLRNTYRLYRASEDEFVDVARTLIRDVKGSPWRPDEDRWRRALSTVFEIWNERAIQTDISPLWIDYAARETPKRTRKLYVHEIPKQENLFPIQHFVRAVAETKGLPAAEKFLAAFRLKSIGDEQQQQELSKLLATQKSVISNSEKLEPVGNYLTIAQSLKSRKTFWLGVKEMQRFRFPFQINDYSTEKITSFLSEFNDDEFDESIEWLEQSNALASLCNFNPLFRTTEAGLDESVWRQFLKRVRTNISKSERDKLSKYLSEITDPTFGERLLEAFAKEAKPVNIYELLGEDLESFTALPLEQKNKLAKFAQEMIDNNASQSEQNQLTALASEAGKAAKQKCDLLMQDFARIEVADLMQAERFQELGFANDEFLNWAQKLFAAVKGLPPNEVIAAIAKLKEFASVKAISTQTDNRNETLESRWISEMVGRNIDTHSIHLVLAALENESLQDVSIRGLSPFITQFLQTQFSNSKAKIQEQDKTVPDNTRSVQAIEQLIQQLGTELGDRDFTPLLPELYGFCFALSNSNEISAIAEWLDSGAETKYPKITKSFQLAFDFKKNSKRRSINLQKNLQQSDSANSSTYLQDLLAFVDDDSKSLQARFRVAMELMRNEPLDRGKVTTCCRVIAEGYDAGQRANSSDDRWVFDALLKSVDDPDIKNTMNLYANSWVQSIKRHKQYFPESCAIQCLKVLALTENEASANDLLNDSASSNTFTPKITATLIELGFSDKALKRFDRICSGNKLPSVDYTLVPYTTKLDAELPKFLERLDDDGRRYFAELYFASQKNAHDEKELHTTRESRMAALAERFSEIKFKSKRDRQMSLIVLSEFPFKLEAIDQVLTREVERLPVSSIFWNSRSNINGELFTAYFPTQIRCQNFAPVQAKWKAINQLLKTRYPESLPSTPLSLVKKLSSTACNAFYKRLHDQTPEQIAKLLPVLRDLNDPSYPAPLNPNTARLAHLMAGKPTELAEFMQQNQAVVLASGESLFDQIKSFEQLTYNLNVPFLKINPTNPKVRINFATSAWRFAKSQKLTFNEGASRSNYTGIKLLSDLKILTADQILEVGPELAKTDSLNGLVWLHLAQRQVKDGQLDKAADSFKKSVEEATDTMKFEKFNRRAEYAKALIDLKRNAEAETVINGIPADKLTAFNRENLRFVKEKLKKN